MEEDDHGPGIRLNVLFRNFASSGAGSEVSCPGHRGTLNRSLPKIINGEATQPQVPVIFEYNLIIAALETISGSSIKVE
jgi:hypothetical protein